MKTENPKKYGQGKDVGAEKGRRAHSRWTPIGQSGNEDPEASLERTPIGVDP